MVELSTIEELQNEIKSLQVMIKSKQVRVNELMNKMISNKSDKHMYKRNINTTQNEITKHFNRIKQLEYQISVGGRKLKTSITVTKDLISLGFKKGEYSASQMVRGWGEWKGEFTIKNNPTYLLVDWFGKYEERFNEFYNYLVDKYSEDVSRDECKNVTIMK